MEGTPTHTSDEIPPYNLFGAPADRPEEMPLLILSRDTCRQTRVDTNIYSIWGHPKTDQRKYKHSSYCTPLTKIKSENGTSCRALKIEAS